MKKNTKIFWVEARETETHIIIIKSFYFFLTTHAHWIFTKYALTEYLLLSQKNKKKPEKMYQMKNGNTTKKIKQITQTHWELL